MKLKTILRHLMGPMSPAQGCHFGGFWGHFGVIFEAKTHAKIDDKIHRFFESGFCWILVCFGVHFCVDFCRFSGLATTDREKPRYVKFVDSIEKLTDVQEN